MIKGQAVGTARAAIVTGDTEAIEAELFHDRDLIAGQGAHRVGGMVWAARRLAAGTEAAQIAGHDREVPSQSRGDLVPHQVRLREAMQQQEPRSVAAVPHVNRRLSRVDPRLCEPVEHVCPATMGLALWASGLLVLSRRSR